MASGRNVSNNTSIYSPTPKIDMSATSTLQSLLKNNYFVDFRSASPIDYPRPFNLSTDKKKSYSVLSKNRLLKVAIGIFTLLIAYVVKTFIHVATVEEKIEPIVSPPTNLVDKLYSPLLDHWYYPVIIVLILLLLFSVSRQPKIGWNDHPTQNDSHILKSSTNQMNLVNYNRLNNIDCYATSPTTHSGLNRDITATPKGSGSNGIWYLETPTNPNSAGMIQYLQHVPIVMATVREPTSIVATLLMLSTAADSKPDNYATPSVPSVDFSQSAGERNPGIFHGLNGANNYINVNLNSVVTTPRPTSLRTDPMYVPLYPQALGTPLTPQPTPATPAALTTDVTVSNASPSDTKEQVFHQNSQPSSPRRSNRLDPDVLLKLRSYHFKENEKRRKRRKEEKDPTIPLLAANEFVKKAQKLGVSKRHSYNYWCKINRDGT